MKKISSKLFHHLENIHHINLNPCQANAIFEIEKLLKNRSKINLFKKSSNPKSGIYIQGDVGVGKSILLKSLKLFYPDSELLHFNELIFQLQSKSKKNQEKVYELITKKLIIIDEFFIDNLTSLILFEKFLLNLIKLKIPVIMCGNKHLSLIYDDPTNQQLCTRIKELFNDFFYSINIKSKLDYRITNKIDYDFFLIKKNKSRQDIIIKKLSCDSSPRKLEFERIGNKFSLDNTYGNLIDLDFIDFFNKNLVFQDYMIIAKKIKIFVIRDIMPFDESSKNLISRFISFIDVLYENKNILSISTNVGLDEIYSGRTNYEEFKRTISRLKEMGSQEYINENLNNL